MRRAFIKLASICAPILLGGCLAFGDVDHRATVFDQGVGSFQNRAILLNLVRASLKEPMYFVSVGPANAQGFEDLRASLPTFETGQGLTPAQRALTYSSGGTTFLDNQTYTNAQMNVFSTHDFYQGFMEPLTLDEVDLLLRQGYPRELVFYLTIARAKITPLGADFKPDPNNPPYYIYNDPNGDAANYAKFAGHIELAMEAGLTTDVEAKPAETGSADKVIAAAPAPSSAPGAAKGGVEFVVKGEAAPAPKVVECLDQALQSKPGRDFVTLLKSAGQPVHLCGETEAGTQKNVVFWPDPSYPHGYQPQQIEIVFRSTYEIFRYLGGLMNEGGSPATACPTLQSLSAVPPQNPNAAPLICDYTNPDTPTPVGPLFQIVSDSGVDACFTAVSYASRRYCIPKNGPQLDTTKDVFNILVSLIALKQSPGDLPTPQAVLLQ